MPESAAPTMTIEDAAAKPAVGTTQEAGKARAKAQSRWFNRTPDASRNNSDGPKIQDLTLPRGELVSGTGTGDKSEFIAKFLDRKQQTGERNVTIESETVRKNFDFLSTYVSTLGSSAELEDILRDPAHLSDKLLMDKLSDKVIGADGKILRRRVNMDRVYEHLQSADGLTTTTMLLEQESLMIKMGLGMDALIQNQFSRGQKEQSRTATTVLDNIPTLPNLAKTGMRETALALVAAGYFAVGTGKSRSEFRDDNDLLADVLTNTSNTQKAYYRARTGIDLDRINPDGTYKDGYRPDISALQASVTVADNLRRENLNQLDFDKPDRWFGSKRIQRNQEIRYPEEFIFNQNVNSEALPVGYTQEIIHEYGNMIGGLVNPTRYQRLDAMARARSTVMVRKLERDYKEHQAVREKGREANVINLLEEKQKRMKEKPDEFRSEQRTKLTEERDKAKTVKEAAEARKKELFPEAAGERTKAVRALEEAFTSDEFGVEISDDIEQAIKDRKVALQKEINKALTPLKIVLEKRFDEAKKAEERITKSFETAMSHIPTTAKTVGNLPDLGASITAALSSVEQRYNPLLAPLQAKYDRLSRQLEGLEKKHIEYQHAIPGENATTEVIRARNPEMLKKSQDAVDTFLVPVPPFVGGLLSNMDEIRTKSVDELIGLLPATMPNLEKLDIALKAKAQEEIRRTTRLSPNQEAILTLLSTVTPPVTRDDVLRYDKSDVYDILEDYYSKQVGGGGAGSPNAADKEKARRGTKAAVKGASKQLRALAEARITQEVTYYAGIEKAKTEEIEKASNFKEKEPEVAAAVTILKNATSLGDENTLSRMYELSDNPTKVAELLNATPIAATDIGFSSVEVGKERYVVEWYRVLFPQYMNDPERRDEMFNAVTRVLPPAQLQNFLLTHFYGVRGDQLQRTARELINEVKAAALVA